LINSTPEIPLLSSDLHEQLVNMLSIAQLGPLSSQGSGVLGSELQAPEANGFVSNNNATLGQDVLNVAKAQCESVVQPDGASNDLGRETVAFVAGFCAGIVAEHADCRLT
jgi:hypothetical protein